MCNRLLTIDDIYNSAKEAAFLSPQLKAKDNAVAQVKARMVKWGLPNPDDYDCPEDEVFEFCHKNRTLFSMDGNIIR